MAKVKPIPDGYRTVQPYLTVDDAAKAIEYYKRAFGATELMRMPMPPHNKIAHAEIKIGDSIVMLSDEFKEMGGVSPKTLGGSPCATFLYVEDVDKTFKAAIDAGGTVKMPPSDMFWGDRYGMLTDPFGHQWSIATHVEDVSPEETARRQEAHFAQKK
jgi:PhnB protein